MKIKYIANDGREFWNQEACLVYEKSIETYKRMEKKKLADQLIIKDFHLVPQVKNADDDMYYTYFRVTCQEDLNLLKEVFNIDFLNLKEEDFPEILICGSGVDLENKDMYQDKDTYEKFELFLDEFTWDSLSGIQQDTIEYWEDLGYKVTFEKQDSSVLDEVSIRAKKVSEKICN